MTNFLIRGDDFLKHYENFELVGRDDELKWLTSILMRRRANSVMLVGPGGVGITALCVGLQASKKDPNAPFDIVSKRMFWLDTDGLFSSGNTTEINSSFQKIMNTLANINDSILLIEDTRDFIEGARNCGSMHFINALNTAVKNGKTQVIFEVRDEDLDMVLKSHSDMRECYTLMDLEEPINGALQQIVNNGAISLAKFHDIKIADEAINTAIELTTKYRTKDQGLSRAQPERAMTLLDRALSSYRLEAHERPPRMVALKAAIEKAQTDEAMIAAMGELDAFVKDWTQKQIAVKEFYRLQRQAENEILQLEDAIAQQKAEEQERRESGADLAPRARSFAEMGMNGGFMSPEVAELEKRKKIAQEIVATNKQNFENITKVINSELQLTREIVLKEFSRISGVSVSKLNEDERAKLSRLEGDLGKRIFGQSHVLKAVADGVKVFRLGRRGGGKPLPYLFLGPSGVGKTELSKALAASLLDDENALTRFDMSEYMEKHGVAKLIGAPPGYEGFEVGGILTNAMRKNPSRILLFDEIEKAHPDVFNIFLQILSDGRLTDNVGRTVSFGDAFVIMTTNIGQAEFLNQLHSFEEAKANAMIELGQTYRSEFLNRFNGRQNIICFNALDLESIEMIVRREINEIDKSYREQGITTEISDDDLGAFCKDNYDPAIGARGLPGYIKANIEPFIVNHLLEQPDFKGTLLITYDRDRKSFTTTLKSTETDERSAA